MLRDPVIQGLASKTTRQTKATELTHMNEELKARLKSEFGLDDAQIAALEKEGVKQDGDLALLSADQIKSITGCGQIPASKIAKAFAPVQAAAQTFGAIANFDILPALPKDDDAWLNSLKVGGILNFNRDTVVGAISAAFASKLGLYGLPEKLVAAMEAQAKALRGPVPPEFYAIQNTLTERR